MNSSPPPESLNLAVNLTPFKRLGFYYLFDPAGNTVCNVNVCRVFGALLILVAQIVIVYGVLGFYSIGADESIDHTVRVQLLFAYLIESLCLVKTVTFVCKANGIWQMFSVADSDFLAGTQCLRHAAVLRWYHDRSVTIINVLSGFAILAAVQWALYPIVSNSLFVEDVGQWRQQNRFENIINFRYSVTVDMYNDRYLLFYAGELLVTVFFVYVYVIFDVFFISFCYDIIARYEMIARAFENVGHYKNLSLDPNDQGKNENVSTDDDYYEDFKSILIDQQKLYLELKSYYSIIKIIILSSIIINSGAIINLSYSFVVIYMLAESLSFLSMLKLATAFSYLFFDLFFICYLIDSINIKKKSIKFRMYGCNWTVMNKKVQKLLLLSMVMDDANGLMIKISPKIIINLQFFSSVMNTTFNIVSVMLKSYSK